MDILLEYLNYIIPGIVFLWSIADRMQKGSKRKLELEKVKDIYSYSDINEMKKHVRILLVDNDHDVWEDLKVLSEARGFNIFYREDIKFIHEVEPYDIAIIDMKDVAPGYGGEHEGLSYVIDAAKEYPEKRFYLYTGNPLGRKVKLLEGLAEYVEKPEKVDDWQSSLLKSISEMMDNKNNKKALINSKLARSSKNVDIVDKALTNYYETYDINKLVSDLNEAFADAQKVSEFMKKVIK